MTVSEFRQAIAVLLLSAGLSATPTLAQANSSQPAHAATPAAPVNGKVVEDIVARVNDQIVTQSDYDRAAEQLQAEAKQQGIPAQQVAQKQADLLRDLIDQQLLLSKAKELGITGETELIKRLDEIRKQNHLDTMEDLEKAAAQQGVSYEDFKASIRNSIVTQQVVRDEVGRHIQLTPAEVQKYYKAHEAEFAQPESVTLNEILIPTPGKTAGESPDAQEVAAAQAQADAIEAKLAAGAKFADMAKPAPTDPNAPKSVALGEFKRGMLAKEIEDQAFALNAGQYTKPIRTKQGFIILQVTDHTQGGEAGFKKVEPQVEEALFLEQMQPRLREYLTKLREEAYVELKPGAVDTGASGNEMRLSYSAYTPPAEKKKKKFQRTRFRGRDRSRHPQTTTQTAAAKSAPATPAAAKSAAADTTVASNSTQGIEKPGKREKIRFGQAPRESLPASQVATAAAPDNGPGVTVPDSRVINPDGTISGAAAPVQERKTRLSDRPSVKKAKKSKEATDTPVQTPPEDLADQKVQDAPLGLADPSAQKKTKQKGEKTRYSAKHTEQDQTQPYLGEPANNLPASSGTEHPPAPTNPPAPATGPPDPIPPGAQQP